jgi:hypothetical protein
MCFYGGDALLQWRPTGGGGVVDQRTGVVALRRPMERGNMLMATELHLVVGNVLQQR